MPKKPASLFEKSLVYRDISNVLLSDADKSYTSAFVKRNEGSTTSSAPVSQSTLVSGYLPLDELPIEKQMSFSMFW